MRRTLPLAAALLLPLPALAHPGGAEAHGLLAGLAHPFGGWDHLAAMVTLGLWAGLLGGAMRWWLPAAFLAGMGAGGLVGLAGVPLPGIEAGILASVILLGAMLAAAARLPAHLVLPLAAILGAAHGHAHGMEAAGGGAGYVAGFLLATALLHGAGLALAAGANRPARRMAFRLAGAACAGVGVLAWVVAGA